MESLVGIGVAIAIVLFQSGCQEAKMSPQEKLTLVAQDYIEKNKKWERSDFEIECELKKTSGGKYLVTVVHKDDLANPVPGGGKSIQLEVDPKTMAVTKELAFQ
jgi:hypothetical protein